MFTRQTLKHKHMDNVTDIVSFVYKIFSCGFIEALDSKGIIC